MMENEDNTTPQEPTAEKADEAQAPDPEVLAPTPDDPGETADAEPASPADTVSTVDTDGAGDGDTGNAGSHDPEAGEADEIAEAAAPAAPPAPSGDTEDTAAVPDAPRVQSEPKGSWWWGLGRRKTSVARVRIRPGEGLFLVNKKPYEEFFHTERDRNDLTAVLSKTSTKGALDIQVNVRGGGTTGQAGAIILGLARALNSYDPSLEPILRDNNFLTRDPRKVERKKYGMAGARKKFQFSKR